MKKISILIMTIFCVFLMAFSVEATPTKVLHLGDQTVEKVQVGNSGTNAEDLGYWFSENGITNTDGSAVNPVTDQLQYELFYTDVTRTYEVEFLGIGRAGFHSPFGVFTYGSDPLEEFDSASLAFQDALFVQNEVETNTKYQFTIEAGTYFGFYLDSNGNGTKLTTMVDANPKPTSGKVNNKGSYTSGLDHALFFETNKGYTIAFEDIVGGGDFDFEDLVVNFAPTDGSGFSAVPEPSTFFLLGIGLIGIAGIARKKFTK